MHNRQKDEIIRDILTVCNGGAILTKVMFHACLTHEQATSYLQLLAINGFIERATTEKTFHITAKGREYVLMMERLTDLLPMVKRRGQLQERLISSYSF
ncbi:MAG TPA: winged helix-turn-helix domain-containing protein [Nitrososphaera sp.]|nr:winged helix-turn-helix domain-containing protein [Nitrososphaera sp.]